MPRIMIVDDDVTIQMELAEYLIQMNHDVVGIADNGSMAVNMARDLRPDLILMDVVMPGEIDGISAAQRIKRETDAAVVFITGFDDPEYIDRAKKVEPFGYVMKPFDQKEIRGVIEIVMSRRELEFKLKAAHDRLERTNRDLQLEIAEHERTERALRESETKYRRLAENSPAVVYQFMMTPEGTYLFPYMSPSMHDVTGISAEALMRDPGLFLDRMHTEDRDRFSESVMRSAESLVPWHDIYRFSLEGEERWIEGHSTPERQPDGRILWDGLLFDVTKRKRAEEALAESEKKYKALYGTTRLMCDNAPDMIWAKDLKGRFLFANEAMCRNRLMAKDTNEPIGKTEAYFIEREKQRQPNNSQWYTLGEGHADSAKIVLQSKQPGKFEETGYVKGKYVHLDVRKAPFLDEKGRIIGTVGCGRDITNEKALEAEHDTLLDRARVAAENYRDLVENINDVIFSTDENGILTYMSPRVTPLMGYDPSEIMGKSFAEFVHPDDLPYALGRFQEIEKGKFKPSEYRLRSKSGPYHWVRASTRPIYLEDRFAGLKGLLTDITEEMQLKEDLLQARKMEAISTLTGGIAHDYNNLMSIIIGNLSMAMEEAEPGSLLADFLSKANTTSFKVRDLTHELMALSKGGEPVKKVGSLDEILRAALIAIPTDTGISVNKSMPQDLWQVPHDPYKMGAVFRNVVTNAVEAMPDGGTLTIMTENLHIVDRDQYPEVPLKQGDYVHISIQDQGKGIQEEHLEKIFDPYFTTKQMGVQKGMGLGLATSYAIVKKHDGHIAIASSPGTGTTVNIYLPAKRQTMDVDVAIPVKNTIPLMKRVLVMDDEEMLRDLTEKMLERLGYTVETVKDGLEAIETYKKQKDSGKPFDVVILDLTIKGGMGGEPTMRELLLIDPHIRAIVSSGYFNDPVVAHYWEHGFRGALAKPYKKDDLERALKEALD